MPPVEPMLAKAVKGLPDPAAFPGGLGFEPKWDGFRCILFRDRDEIELASRNAKDLTRYFPELVEALREHTPERCVLDGEIVIVMDGRLDFECLQERVHPAQSRVRALAEVMPASFVAFDILAEGETSYLADPFRTRRARLEAALGPARAPVHVTPMTFDGEVAARWFAEFEGAGLDGLVAKPLDRPYEPGVRAMLKVKHERTADVVLAGYRLHRSSTPERPLVGSLLLGLYDATGRLQHVGVCASFTAARRAELVGELRPLEVDPSGHPWGEWGERPAGHGRIPGSTSRWSTGKDLSFVALDPARVLEVAYDHMEGTRFRHTTQFRRWRPERDPRTCGYEQLDEPARYELAMILPGAGG